MLHSASIIPVYREESKHHFVDPSIFEPVEVTVDGDVFKTSFLKVNNSVSLLGISQTEKDLEAGKFNPTDGVDALVIVKELLLSDGQVVDVRNNPCSPFVFKAAGNYREMHLNMQGRLPGSDTYHVTGTLNVETGVLEVIASSIQDNIKVVGFKLDAKRINTNIDSYAMSK